MTTTTLLPPVEAPSRLLVDVSQAVDRICRSLADLAGTRRVAITREVIGDCRIAADAAELDQVLSVFLADAVRASEWEEYVAVRTSARNGTVHVDIVTSGPGARGRTARILEAFLPVAPGTPVSPLCEARRRLERLGGRLRTSTDLGRNSTFTVILPRQRLAGRQPLE